MREAINGEEPDLPAWEDWGGLARDGLRAMVVGFVYMLPAIVVTIAGFVIYLLVTFQAVGQSGLLPEGDILDIGIPLGMFTGMAAMFASMAIGTALYLVGVVPLPFALAELAAKNNLSAAFRVRSWWPILTVDKLGYFVDWVVVAGVAAIGYAAAMLVYYTGVLCWASFFMMAPLMLYVMLIAAVLFGQRYRRNKAALGS